MLAATVVIGGQQPSINLVGHWDKSVNLKSQDCVNF